MNNTPTSNTALPDTAQEHKNPKTKLGTILLLPAIIIVIVAVIFGINKCDAISTENQANELGQAYAQRMNELVYSCTKGETDATIEVKLSDSKLSFSLAIPAGEESAKSIERIKELWTSGVNGANRMSGMVYASSSVTWVENGQTKTAYDTNGDFCFDYRQ